jgi:hypothetical protein
MTLNTPKKIVKDTSNTDRSVDQLDKISIVYTATANSNKNKDRDTGDQELVDNDIVSYLKVMKELQKVL